MDYTSLKDEFQKIMEREGGILGMIDVEYMTEYPNGENILRWTENADEIEIAGKVIDDSVMAVSDTQNLSIGCVVKFRNSNETMLVWAVDHGGDIINVKRQHNGFDSIIDEGLIDIVYTPERRLNKIEEYNYFQDFHVVITYRDDNRALYELLGQLQAAVIWGERNRGGLYQHNQMRGLYKWLQQNLIGCSMDDTYEEILKSLDNETNHKWKKYHNVYWWRHGQDIQPEIRHDDTIPSNHIFSLDMDKIALVFAPKGEPTVKEVNGEYHYTMTASLKIHDHKTCHAMAYNISSK